MEEGRGAERQGEWGWKDFAWGNGHTMQCANDILLSCTLESSMVL